MSERPDPEIKVEDLDNEETYSRYARHVYHKEKERGKEE